MNDDIFTTVGVIVSRLDKGLRCIRALAKSTVLPHCIIIVFVGEKNAFESLISEIEETIEADLIHIFVKSGPPSELRNIILEHNKNDRLLFLDDDIYLKPHTIEKFHEFSMKMGLPTPIVVGCAVIENGFYRELGANFSYVSRKNVWKIRLEQIHLSRFRYLSHEAEKVDLITQPPFYISGLKHKSYDLKFDEKYPWAFEIFDWFMNLKQQNIGTYVIPFEGAEHHPGGYSSNSVSKKQKNQIGFELFSKKWGLIPEKHFKYTFLNRVFREIVEYYRKKIRVFIKRAIDRR